MIFCNKYFLTKKIKRSAGQANINTSAKQARIMKVYLNLNSRDWFCLKKIIYVLLFPLIILILKIFNHVIVNKNWPRNIQHK